MHCIIPNTLWIGSAREVADLQSIADAGVQALLDLAANEPLPKLTRDFPYLRLPLLDGGDNPPARIRATVRSLLTLIKENIPTLVYCSAGVSRSPCIAAAAISKLRGISADDALRLVTKQIAADVSPLFWGCVKSALSDGGIAGENTAE